MAHNNLALIFMKGCEHFGEQVEYYLNQWEEPDASLVIQAECPRFADGEGKGVVYESVRGKDIFIVADPFNYSVTYKMYGTLNHMSPDDHFQDVKRIISAIGGKARRITVILPRLYGGRQDRRNLRESLDCAHALQELGRMGVAGVVTFDAHEPRVQNAIPLTGFDNFMPKYQMLKALLRQYQDVVLHKDGMVMIAPDPGAANRCISYADTLGLDMGLFYKRRNFQTVVGGENPIAQHVYIGDRLDGKDAVIVDDMVASGASLLDTFRAMRREGAKRSFAFITFGVFSSGFDVFDEAYRDGLFEKIFVTNLVYNPPELIARPWASIVDMTKYAAYIIAAIHHDDSVAALIDPEQKIAALLSQK
ncbi:MAG: ribose-phosphate diphosphokinase [Oscillospiraceae bacterium]|jgi:ribose-phosphate pyrophosphokinase|nr:ribose-phosphate diphosphokinase [Oscillospiraceae bacterium]